MGGEMSYNTIQRMLSNRRYIGELRSRDVVQPNAIPALVSEDLFNKVQEKLAKNKKAPARHKAEESYLLTTKLYCGKCGALMFGESGVSHTGKMYTYYKCAAAKKKKTCDKKAVRKQWLEDLVVNETMKLVEDDASMNAIIAKVMELQNQESTDLPIYEKQLKETETGITNMLNAIQMGILTSSTKERLEALEEQRKELSGFPFHIHRILRNFPVQTGCLSSFPEEQSSDVPDYSFGHLLSGSISAVPAREYRFGSRE